MIKINNFEIRKGIKNGCLCYKIYDSKRCFAWYPSLKFAIRWVLNYYNFSIVLF